MTRATSARAEGADAAQRTSAIPLFLIAGFLGAGKTTLIRAVLPRLEGAGLRPHVILNDYENATIDAASLGADPGVVTPISGTCICCGSQDELMAALAAAEGGPDRIMLIEANGTADTAELIELLTADRRAARFTPPVQITVIDADRWGDRGIGGRVERVQAQTARYLRLTRWDSVPEEEKSAKLESLRAVAPRATPVDVHDLVGIISELRSSASSLPPRRFDAGGHAKDDAALGRAEPTGHHHAYHDDAHHDHAAQHHFSSLEIALPAPIDEAEFRELLQSLPTEVIRVKGVARLAPRDLPVYFQRTDRPDSVELFPILQRGKFDSVAVLIGVGLDGEALRDRFRVLAPSIL